MESGDSPAAAGGEYSDIVEGSWGGDPSGIRIPSG